MDNLKLYIPLLLLVILQSCSTEENNKQIQINQNIILGSDRLLNEYSDLINDKRLGIISNRASVLSDGTLLIDTLSRIKGIKIQAIFTPEHGFEINADERDAVTSSIMKKVTVYSLYPKTRKPTPVMLKNIDLLIFDLQDIGTRFYTYISTLYYVMQAAGENNIPLIVLDRPNPVGGINVAGPVLDTVLKSFIGIAPIPLIHGMTIGELAEMFAGEGWIGKDIPDLKVIKMINWKRDIYFDDYNLKWIKPSPNMPDIETAILYPAIALLEGTNISEGRGTEFPFKNIGSPFINSGELINELDSLKHNGVSIKPVTFIPVNLPGKADNPKFENQKCYGISFHINDRDQFKEIEFGIKLLYSIHKLYPEKFKFNAEYFDKLTGEKTLRLMLKDGETPGKIISSWQKGLNNFLKIRKKYLLY